MAYEQRDNSGSIFANEDRSNEKSPNAKGKAMIDGVMYFMDAWTKTSVAGIKFQSFSFKRMDKQAEAKQAKPVAKLGRTAPFDDDGSIPF